jgi:hypothetical protein
MLECSIRDEPSSSSPVGLLDRGPAASSSRLPRTSSGRFPAAGASLQSDIASIARMMQAIPPVAVSLFHAM